MGYYKLFWTRFACISVAYNEIYMRIFSLLIIALSQLLLNQWWKASDMLAYQWLLMKYACISMCFQKKLWDITIILIKICMHIDSLQWNMHAYLFIIDKLYVNCSSIRNDSDMHAYQWLIMKYVNILICYHETMLYYILFSIES